MKKYIVIVMAALISIGLAACGDRKPQAEIHEDADSERGPNGGRLLRDGDFALEVTIFEKGQPPAYRVYPTQAGQPLDPKRVELAIVVKRLDGEENRFAFVPEGFYLAGQSVVAEPHSFDVTVTATHDGKQSRWTYPSYEGRVTIDKTVADAAGIAVEPAGPAVLVTTIDLLGRVEFAPAAKAEVKARFPGVVTRALKTVGDSVRVGETLAIVESSQSLQSYAVTAPIAGVVLERRTNVGDVASADALYVIGDLSRVQANLHVFPGDVARIGNAQKVTVRSLDGRMTTETTVSSFLPTAEAATQTLVVRAALPNADKRWLPGMAVQASVVVAEESVPLAVRTSGLQRFRDFTVVFAQVGETYEVRMLDLGRQSKDWAEVLGGIKTGQAYVVANSFLIKADIEKSGASHDH